MRDRSAERGNTILIATVLVLGLTVMGLGVAKFVRAYAASATDRKGAGYPALQAHYMAELGINQFMYSLNNKPFPVASDPPPPGPIYSGDLDPELSYSPTFGATTSLAYKVTSAGLPVGGSYPYLSQATASLLVGSSGWTAVTRSVRFSVKHNGSNWVVEDYSLD